MSFLTNNSLNERSRSQVNANQQVTALREEDECKELLKASIQVAAETNIIAERTAQELEVQSDQIHRIHNDAQETSNNLEATNYLLNGMKSWWSSLGQLLTSPPQPKKVGFVERNTDQESKAKCSTQPCHEAHNARSDLSQLSQMLEEMKSRAIETGKELKHQNAELQEIRNLSEVNEKQVDKQRKKLHNLLK